MKVLVVGGTGVLGAAVVEQLSQREIPAVHMSRRPTARSGWVHGDITRDDLGLDDCTAKALKAEVTHVVNCAGSVDLGDGPVASEEMFVGGTCNLLNFLDACRQPCGYVHASSILVFGQTDKTVGNRDLDVGQRFRSCYERSKFDAEQVLHRSSRAYPITIVRLGPLLGADGPVLPSINYGILSALPYILKHYPVPLARRGQFCCYPTDSVGAARILVAALRASDGQGASRPRTWTYYDPSSPTMNQTLTALCGAWNVVPRIVDMPLTLPLAYALGPRMGLPRTVLPYSRPWVQLDPDVLQPLPPELASPQPDFIARTGRALHQRSKELMSA
jgi:nucleoside-diphosphate-sugar epimerase